MWSVVKLAVLVAVLCVGGSQQQCTPSGDHCPWVTCDTECCSGLSTYGGPNGWHCCDGNGAGCSDGSKCCAGFCKSSGTCGLGMIGDSCGADSDCLIPKCVGGSCSCTDIGNSCGEGDVCCSGNCINGMCNGCQGFGGLCLTAADCCYPATSCDYLTCS